MRQNRPRAADPSQTQVSPPRHVPDAQARLLAARQRAGRVATDRSSVRDRGREERVTGQEPSMFDWIIEKTPSA
jgi:hypothetical protein